MQSALDLRIQANNSTYNSVQLLINKSEKGSFQSRTPGRLKNNGTAFALFCAAATLRAKLC